MISDFGPLLQSCATVKIEPPANEPTPAFEPPGLVNALPGMFPEALLEPERVQDLPRQAVVVPDGLVDRFVDVVEVLIVVALLLLLLPPQAASPNASASTPPAVTSIDARERLRMVPPSFPSTSSTIVTLARGSCILQKG